MSPRLMVDVGLLLSTSSTHTALVATPLHNAHDLISIAFCCVVVFGCEHALLAVCDTVDSRTVGSTVQLG